MKSQHNLILQEASKRGLDILPVDESKLHHLINYQSFSLELFEGTFLELLNDKAVKVFDNKQHLKDVLKESSVRTIPSISFQSIESPLVTDFIKSNSPFVCKPTEGTEGEAVELGLTSYNDLKDYWTKYSTLANDFMLEEQVDYKDLRIQVIDGEITAACTRTPARVIGNGKNTLIELIGAYKKRVLDNNPGNSLIIDESLITHISTNLIPAKNQTIQLNRLANMSQGALAVDVTDAVHPNYQVWIDEIVKLTGAKYFGMDILTNNSDLDPYKEAYLLEVNAKPEWVHHTFSEGRRHDIAKILLDQLI